jgi:putative salt-induced outer membrane protein
MSKCSFLAILPLVGLLLPDEAWAQDPAGTGTGVAQASSGATELDGQGTHAAAERNAADVTDATELTTSAGGILSTGNANAAALTGSLNFRLRRKAHQFTAIALGNYASARLDQDSPMETTVGNVQGRLRYDYYFADRWSVFGMGTARHDPFQQLDLRLNVDPGVAFYAMPDNDHRLWFELGYDFQYDIRNRAALVYRDEDGNALDGPGGAIVDDEAQAAIDPDVPTTATNHAARLFAGYANRLNSHVTFETGLEYLQSVIDPARLRVNWDTGVAAALGEKLSLSTTFTLRYDNAPLPDVARLDTVTAVSIVYRLM